MGRDEDSREVSRILADAEAGRPVDLDGLLPFVYSQLERLAARQMAGERRDHTLEPAALVNEAYLRLPGKEGLPWRTKRHFYAAAAEAMRRILIDHARKRARLRRGGDRKRLPASILDIVSGESPVEFLAVDEALRRLEGEDPKAARVVRLRFFAGLSVAETAEALEISPRSVAREWAFARAWLFQQLGE